MRWQIVPTLTLSLDNFHRRRVMKKVVFYVMTEKGFEVLKKTIEVNAEILDFIVVVRTAMLRMISPNKLLN